MAARTIPVANENDVEAAQRLLDADNPLELVAAVVAELRWARNLLHNLNEETVQ